MRILILCTGNSCRSQMAAGFLRQLRPGWEVLSAGTFPAAAVHPRAVALMGEVGIDISAELPQAVGPLVGQPFDAVITVCDNARESCPTFSGPVERRLHAGFPDPAELSGTDAERLAGFRQVRDDIGRRFAALAQEIGGGS